MNPDRQECRDEAEAAQREFADAIAKQTDAMNSYCRKHDLFNCWYCIVTPEVTGC